MTTQNTKFYYFQTPDIVVDKLYTHLNYSNKNSIVDLGAGQGVLIKPLIDNKSLRKIAIEINEDVNIELQSLYDEVLIGNLITSKVLGVCPRTEDPELRSREYE